MPCLSLAAVGLVRSRCERRTMGIHVPHNNSGTPSCLLIPYRLGPAQARLGFQIRNTRSRWPEIRRRGGQRGARLSVADRVCAALSRVYRGTLDCEDLCASLCRWPVAGTRAAFDGMWAFVKCFEPGRCLSEEPYGSISKEVFSIVAPIAQPVEAVDLKSIQSGFESRWGYWDVSKRDGGNAF